MAESGLIYYLRLGCKEFCYLAMGSMDSHGKWKTFGVGNEKGKPLPNDCTILEYKIASEVWND